MKIEVKYCGGCDPSYDRVAFFERIRSAAAGSIQWASYGQDESDALLLICGCARACPIEESPPRLRFVCLTTDARPPEETVDELMGRRD
jgi:hypothetical protein